MTRTRCTAAVIPETLSVNGYAAAVPRSGISTAFGSLRLMVFGITVVTAAATLLPGLRSCSLAVAFALFVITPGAPTVATIETATDPPTARSPNEHVTDPPCEEHVPAVVVAELKLTPPGSTSERRAPVAVLGPVLDITKL